MRKSSTYSNNEIAKYIVLYNVKSASHIFATRLEDHWRELAAGGRFQSFIINAEFKLSESQHLCRNGIKARTKTSKCRNRTLNTSNLGIFDGLAAKGLPTKTPRAKPL